MRIIRLAGTARRLQHLRFSVAPRTVFTFSRVAPRVRCPTCQREVRWGLWGTRGGRFRVLVTATSDPDGVNPIHLGQAGFDVSFNQVGRYSVRAMAVATTSNLASAWTPFRNFIVR